MKKHTCWQWLYRPLPVPVDLGPRLLFVDGFLPVRRAAFVDPRSVRPLVDRETILGRELDRVNVDADRVVFRAAPVRLVVLSLVLFDLRVDELLPAEFLRGLVALRSALLDARFGALAPRFGIFAPERRASL